MLEAALWGLAGASSLLIGAGLGMALPARPRLIGLVMGFGAGALISAVSFELTEEALELGGSDATAAGLALGALAYFSGDRLIARRGGGERMHHKRSDEGSSRALLLGAVLDGIPESAVIGITLLEGGVGAAMLAAVFVSNLPESFAAVAGARSDADSPPRVLARWALVVVACAASSALGYVLLDGASGDLVALIQAFAAGAVLTMLADTMMPEAYRNGGPAVGLVVVFGFALAALLSASG